MANNLGILDIKNALWDERFKNLFPEYKKEIDDFIKNPGCGCNNKLYKLIIGHKDRLKEYFPTKEIGEIEMPVNKNNNWKVINCNINDLEEELKKLSKVPVQVAIARWEDQATAIINLR